MSHKNKTGQRLLQTRRSKLHPVLETGGKTEWYKNLELTSSHRHAQIITHSWVTAIKTLEALRSRRSAATAMTRVHL